MIRQLVVKLVSVMLLSSTPFAGMANVPSAEQWISKLVDSKNNHQPIPNLSQAGVTDMASAYRLQTAFVRSYQSKDDIVGFKASLTTQEMQKLFGIHRPLFGVLFKSGDLSQNPTLSLSATHRLEIETELAFIIKKPIYKTVHSVSDLKKHVGAVVPVLEIPDVGFECNPMNAIDMVAGNTGSYCFLIKRDVNWINKPLNNVAVTLFHNDEIVNQGEANDALGDQWEALRWLVNQVVAEGWTIKEGHVLMTGALGQAVSAKPGKYVARYNEGNALTLNITE